MKKYVKDQNLRGAALPIVRGTRLVYAGWGTADLFPTFNMPSLAPDGIQPL